MASEAGGSVVKVIELVGRSERSFSDAVRSAVQIASRSIRNITGVEVTGSRAQVGADGELTTFEAACRVSFVVESGRIDIGDDLDDTPSGRELVLGGAITEDDLARGGGHEPDR
jgi:flavin-binding protein dodecin